MSRNNAKCAALAVLALLTLPGVELPGAERMLEIRWRLGPDYPMGIQDSAVGVVEGYVVSAGGFTRHTLNVLAAHPDAFGGKKSGFTKVTFAFDPRNEAAGWQRIADLPGPARQGGAVAVVDDAMYVMGGINYDAPHTYRETYRLRRRQGAWQWEELSAARLPWPAYAAAAGTGVIGSKIYLFGLADFFAPPGTKNADFHSEAGRGGNAVGRALLVLDTAHLDAGWKALPDCPGLPQFAAAVAAAGGKLYRLGGIYAPLDPGKGAHYFNAIDSWRYDPAANAWSRLADMPHGANRRALTYADRYILLIAGYQYGETWLMGGKRHQVYDASDKSRDWKALFETTVLVYDTITGKLGTANPLVERTSYPSSAIAGDTVYCLGGEGGPRLWHPATFHIGKVGK
jgi:N-acetylneuraminic acid mutarotase